MNYQFPDTVIQVFCKAPVAGKVKTRLMPELTANQAATVHRKLTRRTLDLVCSSSLCPIQLWCTPDIFHPFFAEMNETFSISLLLQAIGDLGGRMYQALRSGAENYKQAILIGCDCVSLTKGDLQDAIIALQDGKDIVLAPAEDGGYCLIGVHSPKVELFTAISWGTPDVLMQTRENIRLLNLNYLQLQTQWDVDSYADYIRFVKELSLADFG